MEILQKNCLFLLQKRTGQTVGTCTPTVPAETAGTAGVVGQGSLIFWTKYVVCQTQKAYLDKQCPWTKRKASFSGQKYHFALKKQLFSSHNITSITSTFLVMVVIVVVLEVIQLMF